MIAPWLAVAVAAAAPRVAVDVLSREAPRTAEVRSGGAALSLAARGDTLLVDGRPSPPLALPAGRWGIAIPGGPPRAYRAALAIRAERSALRFRADMALEDYVAAVVASETLPGTPDAALEAQAVVVRSYALASKDRHPGGALCDLAHCQILRARGIPGPHLAAAAAAGRATRGVVLRLASGEVAAAAFHASCGGHTADPGAAFGSLGSGAAAAPDPGCPPEPWRADVAPEALADAVRAALARAGDPSSAAVPRRLRARDLALFAGRGGWVGRVASRDGSWAVSGDAFARALDAAVGRGSVRSTRFSLSDAGGSVAVRGRGHGHGVGLCQAGAARRARAGEGWREILRRYFGGSVAARYLRQPCQTT